MAEVYFPLRAVRRMRTVTSGITTVLCSPMRADADAVRAELVTTGGMEMLKDKDSQAQDVIEKYGIVPEEDVLLPEEESELQAKDDEEATEK